MKARVQLLGVIDTVAHAQTIKAEVTAALVGKDIFETHSLDYEVSDEDGSVWFSFDVRFNTEVDRDSIVTWIRNQLADHPTVKTWFLQLEVWWHWCDHDDPPEDPQAVGCMDETLKYWSKGDPWPG